MVKIFFMCTHCNQGTGYARVANMITNHLAENHDVVYYAFQAYKGQEISDRFIDPRIKFYDAIEIDPESPKGFGDAGIIPSFDEEKPDVLFIYNDINVCWSILKLLENAQWKNFKIVLYVDIVYPWEDVKKIQTLASISDKFYVFLNCWKDHMSELGIKTQVLKHGVDLDRFHKVEGAKEKLGFKESDFLILNLNRNSYRKQLPVTIKTFLDFYSRHNEAKLYLSCVLDNEDGFDIRRVIYTECVRRQLDPNEVMNNAVFINSFPTAMTEDTVNLLYNAADVGLNTCQGEGFGLTTIEHAYLGKPQIVSGVPALKETLGEVALVVEPKLWITVNNQESHGGEIAAVDHKDFVDALELVYQKKHTGEGYKEHVENNWSWSDKLKVLDEYFTK